MLFKESETRELTFLKKFGLLAVDGLHAVLVLVLLGYPKNSFFGLLLKFIRIAWISTTFLNLSTMLDDRIYLVVALFTDLV